MQSADQIAPVIEEENQAQSLTGNSVRHVTSKDGTPIAFDRSGDGPALILVDGALCSRSFGPLTPLAALLAPKFTVFTYDRRGRGESGDTKPYAVEREIEDLEALIEEAGGTAYVFGISSGAALALEAANRGSRIKKLALYEAPFIVDDSRSPLPEDYLTRLNRLITEDRRGDAIKMFLKLVGVPGLAITVMQILPVWAKLKAVARTLPYDITIVKENQRGKPLPQQHWAAACAPTLVMEGSKSPSWMRNAMKQLAGVLPNAKLRTLPGQTHNLKPRVVAPQLLDFFGA